MPFPASAHQTCLIPSDKFVFNNTTKLKINSNIHQFLYQKIESREELKKLKQNLFWVRSRKKSNISQKLTTTEIPRTTQWWLMKYAYKYDTLSVEIWGTWCSFIVQSIFEALTKECTITFFIKYWYLSFVTGL